MAKISCSRYNFDTCHHMPKSCASALCAHSDSRVVDDGVLKRSTYEADPESGQWNISSGETCACLGIEKKTGAPMWIPKIWLHDQFECLTICRLHKFISQGDHRDVLQLTVNFTKSSVKALGKAQESESSDVISAAMPLILPVIRICMVTRNDTNIKHVLIIGYYVSICHEPQIKLYHPVITYGNMFLPEGWHVFFSTQIHIAHLRVPVSGKMVHSVSG